MIFSDDQWEIIKKATPHFKSVRKMYLRNAPMWLTEQIITAYESATGKTIFNKDLSCSLCVFRIYQQIGNAYWEDLEEREKLEKENKLEEENKEEINDGKEKTKKKTNSRNSKKKI